MKVISHHFIGGVYAKEMLIPDGYEVISHSHKFDHMSVLTQGCVIVEADGEQSTYYAPAIIEIKAGTNHSVRPVNGDAHWICVHATDCVDESKVDEVLIEKIDKQLNMVKQEYCLDISSLRNQLDEHPELWDEYDMRTRLYENSPHREVSDIWLRYRDWAEFDPNDPMSFADEHRSIFYPAYFELWEVADVIAKVMWKFKPGAKLGGCLITKIPPGKQVYPHSDSGSWHSEYYNRKVLVLLQSAPGQSFNFRDEKYEGKTGEVFIFDNNPVHSVVNNSEVDRISLILAVRDIPDANT
jgi:quercetin dioxygenase-like cupin family protein